MKKLALLAVIFMGLAAFVYFYEIVGEEEREAARDLEESLFRLGEEEVRGLSVRSQEGETVALKKEVDSWRIEQPIEALADEGTVSSFVTTIKNAKRSRTFQDAVEEAGQYGLSVASSQIKVATDAGEKVLLLGAKDFTGNQVYARFEDGKDVFLTGVSLLNSIDKEVNDWRSKDVLVFERSRIAAAEVRREDDVIKLKKVDEEWYLEAPLEELADQTTVSSLFSDVGFAKIQDFIDEPSGELQEYGLEDPSTVLRIRLEGEESWLELALGNLSGETYFARDPQKTSLFTVEKSLFETLNKALWDFRDKEIIDVNQDEVVSLTIRQGEKSLRIRHEEVKWFVEEPEEHRDVEVFSYKFWYPIDDVKFESVLEDTNPLSAVDLSVSMELRDGESRLFEFGCMGDECFARKAATGRKGKISKSDFDKLAELSIEDLIE